MMPSLVGLCEGERFGLGSASAWLPRTEHKLTTGAYANPPHAARLARVCRSSSGQILAGNLPVRGTGPREKVHPRRDALFIPLGRAEERGVLVFPNGGDNLAPLFSER